MHIGIYINSSTIFFKKNDINIIFPYKMINSNIKMIFNPSIKEAYKNTAIINLKKNHIVYNKNTFLFGPQIFMIDLPHGWNNVRHSYFYGSLSHVENLIIKNGYDFDIFSPMKCPRFYVKNLFVVDCNRNFVYNWIEKDFSFKYVENVILYSHPYLPYTLERRFPNMFIHPKFTLRWNNSYIKNMKILNDDEINIIGKYLLLCYKMEK